MLSQVTFCRDTESTIDKIKDIYLVSNKQYLFMLLQIDRSYYKINKKGPNLIHCWSNSSNCNRLRDVSIQSGTNIPNMKIHLKEIDNNWLKGIKELSITSDASTPDKLVVNDKRIRQKNC